MNKQTADKCKQTADKYQRSAFIIIYYFLHNLNAKSN